MRVEVPITLSPFTLFHTIHTLNDPKEKGLSKTLREKEKILETSILSFSDNVF